MIFTRLILPTPTRDTLNEFMARDRVDEMLDAAYRYFTEELDNPFEHEE